MEGVRAGLNGFPQPVRGRQPSPGRGGLSADLNGTHRRKGGRGLALSLPTLSLTLPTRTLTLPTRTLTLPTLARTPPTPSPRPPNPGPQPSQTLTPTPNSRASSR